ncbi:MAG: hypothetical protein HQ491_03415 [Bacteroidetes bacterium]|nr:hypothetical protein [Bacteroidota bacterium]
MKINVITAIAKNSREEIQILKKSLLKTGFRAVCLNIDSNKDSQWASEFRDGLVSLFSIDELGGIFKLVAVDFSDGELYFENTKQLGFGDGSIFIATSFNSKFDQMRQTIIDHFKSQNPQVIVGTNIELTKGSGAHKINEELFRLIRKCNYFIADITPLSTLQDPYFSDRSSTSLNGFWFANSNVMIELGYALATRQLSNLLLIYNEDVVSLSETKLPFDITNINVVRYSLVRSDFSMILEVFAKWQLH